MLFVLMISSSDKGHLYVLNKSALSIGGVISNVHSWSCKPFTDKNGTKWKGAQIDLLIDRADEVINICEIKYVSDKFLKTSIAELCSRKLLWTNCFPKTIRF